MNDQKLRAKLVATADRCVKCGLCLPQCPTYSVREDEAESPRGRIALIQGFAAGELGPSGRLGAHLASCLGCRACEVACPSLAPFGALMDDARAYRNRCASPWRRWIGKLRLRVLSSDRGVKASATIARLYRSTGLGSLVEGWGLPAGSHLRAYHRAAMQLDRPRSLAADSADDQASPPGVALFLGCVAQAAQPGLPSAALHVFARLGIQVRIPRGQCCCGALHRHQGFPADADRLLSQNATAFADRPAIVTASACAAELRLHPQLLGSLEICRFLADIDWPPEAILSSLPARVAVHTPCSQRNILRDGDAAYALLRRIPQVELLALEGNPSCCGAAGTYMLEHPAMSATLLRPRIDRLRQLGADFLVTTNTGCALHLAAGAREAGLDLEVLHPVELIARQLGARPA